MSGRDGSSGPGPKRARWSRFKDGFARRMRHLWHPLLYAGIIGGFLMGRALPGIQIAPFGIAFYTAVRGAGFSARQSLPALVAVAAGSFSVLPLVQSLSILAGLLFGHGVSVFVKLGRRGPSPVGALLVAVCAVLFPAIMLAPKVNVTTLLFWCGVTGAAALVFTMGIADLRTSRFLTGGGGESPVPLIVMLASVLAGLDGLNAWWGIPLRDVAAALMVISCAYVGGPPLGAAAGAVLGLSLLFDNLGGPLPSVLSSLPADSRSMAYVTAGLIAGTFRDLGKTGVGLAFCLGFVTFSMASVGSTHPLLAVTYSAVVATLLFWILPWRIFTSASASLAVPQAPEEGSSTAGQPDLSGLLDRVRAVSRAMKEVSRTYEEVAAVAAPTAEGADRAFEQVTERICRTCSMHSHCWDTEVAKTYQLYQGLWTQIEEEGPLKMHPLPEELERHCIYPGQVAFTLNYLHDLHRTNAYWERRFGEGRNAMGEYVRSAGRMLDRFADEIEARGTRVKLESTPMLRIVSGLARLPKRGGHISGDSYVGTVLDSDRYLMALSDGMGVGNAAAAESRHCINLLTQVLAAGFSSDVAVSTVNSALLMHSTDDSFATIDMFLLDLDTGRGEFVKVGASPSFVIRDADVTLIKTSSVPVGIMHQVEIEPEYRVLKPGDLVVMMTDGIWDVAKEAHDKERWIIEHLERERSNDPEQVAESLLARALDIAPDAGDDMTVLVARVESVTSAARAGGSRATGEPRQLADEPVGDPRAAAEPRTRPAHDRPVRETRPPAEEPSTIAARSRAATGWVPARTANRRRDGSPQNREQGED